MPPLGFHGIILLRTSNCGDLSHQPTQGGSKVNALHPDQPEVLGTESVCFLGKDGEDG